MSVIYPENPDPDRAGPRIDPAKVPVNSITVRQDVGGHYPVYKRVTLDLMPDGTVRWRDVEYDQ